MATIRPLVWSKESVIYTSHPSEPLVLARHFPSSRQFVLPSAPKILSSPGSYEPPTVLSISDDDNDQMLFAYFSLIVIHPQRKLEYFRELGWLDSWVDEANKMVQDTYLDKYHDRHDLLNGKDSSPKKQKTKTSKSLSRNMVCTLNIIMNCITDNRL